MIVELSSKAGHWPGKTKLWQRQWYKAICMTCVSSRQPIVYVTYLWQKKRGSTCWQNSSTFSMMNFLPSSLHLIHGQSGLFTMLASDCTKGATPLAFPLPVGAAALSIIVTALTHSSTKERLTHQRSDFPSSFTHLLCLHDRQSYTRHCCHSWDVFFLMRNLTERKKKSAQPTYQRRGRCSSWQHQRQRVFMNWEN